jgi:Ser/Thr protein kinase RdoA (MazF antagonist)
LFAANGSEALTLIDFDTVGPGLLLQDLGDCLRSCCAQSGEDDYGATVRCNVDFAASTITGYGLENELSGFEQANLHTALYLITFELGLRFFTDYLLGNPYFKMTITCSGPWSSSNLPPPLTTNRGHWLNVLPQP